MSEKKDYLSELISRYPQLSAIKEDIYKAYCLLEETYTSNGKLLIAGNGGSAADSEHIVGELMKSFVLPRKINAKLKQNLETIDKEKGETLSRNLQGALPAIALDGHFALSTAYMNDVEPDLCFAQQVNGFGVKNDVFLGISTSGNSKNIIYAAITAKAKGLKVIGLTGFNNNLLEKIADICVKTPEKETFKIQELHLPIYHCWCLMLEQYFFS